MEQTQKIEFRKNASESIAKIAYYITEKGYPDNAKRFAEKFYEFGNSLAAFATKYPICKQAKLAKHKLHCAVFHKNYIFVYKSVKNTLVIYTVIHCNTNPVFHSA
ncbi:MAG: type II toxin-antitoxin system RelE/ParE family toxin [Bacteroidia bacterium]